MTSESHANTRNVLQRLWDKDASLWTSDPTAQAAIRSRLGWLSIASVMEPQVPVIQAFAQDVKQAGFTHALLLGMGGSSLFAEVCRHTFGIAPGGLDLLVLDTTDPAAIQAAMARAPLERTLFIVSSKSGATTESSALCAYAYDQCHRRMADKAGQQFIAITDAGTPLEAQAQQLRFRRAFVHGPMTGQDVGGRFSALTYFGLVPAALMGVDIRALLSSAQAMGTRCQPAAPLADNPAAQLGVFLGDAYAAGRDKMTLLTSASLSRFGVWVEQLVAESTGKAGKGLVPVTSEPLREPAAYGADRMFVELQLEAERDAALSSRLDALAQAGHPVIRLRWRDRTELGGETIRWFLATAIAASSMQLNPFDEPNVQESKDRTKALLDQYVRDGVLPTESLVVGSGFDPERKRRAEPAPSSEDSPSADGARLREFLRTAKPGDYLAILSFLPRTPELDQAVESLWMRLADTCGVVTTLGYGPRYLHSTGQLHKGGPDTGLFVMLTSDDPVDLPVPGMPYSFSVLKQAQALGDIQALRDRKRRLLHLPLARSPLEALRSLAQPAR